MERSEPSPSPSSTPSPPRHGRGRNPGEGPSSFWVGGSVVESHYLLSLPLTPLPSSTTKPALPDCLTSGWAVQVVARCRQCLNIGWLEDHGSQLCLRRPAQRTSSSTSAVRLCHHLPRLPWFLTGPKTHAVGRSRAYRGTATEELTLGNPLGRRAHTGPAYRRACALGRRARGPA